MKLWIFIALISFFITSTGSTSYSGPWSNNTTTRMRVEYLENSQLITEKKPKIILDVLGIKENDVVADVGCGTGAFTFLISSKIGKNGKVYAVDILDDMLAYIDNKKKNSDIKNIITIKATPSNPNLPPASCDKILLIDTYPFIRRNSMYLTELHKALKKGGIVGIISVRHPRKTKTDSGFENRIIVEMEQAGFKFKEKNDSLGKRYFLVFTHAIT